MDNAELPRRDASLSHFSGTMTDVQSAISTNSAGIIAPLCTRYRQYSGPCAINQAPVTKQHVTIANETMRRAGVDVMDASMPSRNIPYKRMPPKNSGKRNRGLRMIVPTVTGSYQ